MAKKRKPKGAIYYAEYMDNRLGQEVHTGWITRNDLKRIAAAEKADSEGTYKDEDPSPEDLWDELMHTDDTLYLQGEVFGYGKNPIRACAGILKALDSVNGNWGKFGEEGSVAFGLSEKLAIDKLQKLEGPMRLWKDR